MSLPEGLRPPRAVLFDWDNTLVNTWPTIVECYRDTFTALGLVPWTAAEVQDRAAPPGTVGWFFGEEEPNVPVNSR